MGADGLELVLGVTILEVTDGRVRVSSTYHRSCTPIRERDGRRVS